MMRNIQIIFLQSLIFCIPIRTESARYEWAIVGAGLAGITSLAVLLEQEVDPATIIWIDPEFNMGRLGKYYRNVPSNTPPSQLMHYIHSLNAIKTAPSTTREALFLCAAKEHQPLHRIIDPLLDATNYLRLQISSLQDTVNAVTSNGTDWILECDTTTIQAHKVILAIGAHPKTLDYPIQQISLDDALDKDTLATYVNADDCISVFGGMHSAMLVLKHLSELNVKQIVNFYTKHYFYRIPGAESLEGLTKIWVKTVLEPNPPKNLTRLKSTPENLDQFLPLCNKVIYAIGFEKNTLSINGSENWLVDSETGTIAPNLYCIGIACPHLSKSLHGNVAINGFNIILSYAKKLIPRWKSEESIQP